MSASLAGKLLVASPSLIDPNFWRTVVLIVAHSEDDGAVGTILNRPLDVAATEFVEPWGPFLAVPAAVYSGGPVQRAVAIGLAYRPDTPPADGWEPVLDGIGFIDVGRDPEDVPDVEQARVFSGYAGWTQGQLEMEVGIGSWFVVAAAYDDAFGPEPEDLWRTVLRRQRDRLAFFADFPADPRTN
jgi:putative transcriptional regulator